MQRVDRNQSLVSGVQVTPASNPMVVELKPLVPSTLPSPLPPQSSSNLPNHNHNNSNNTTYVKPIYVLPRQDSGRRFSTGTGNVAYVNVKRSRFSSDAALPQHGELDMSTSSRNSSAVPVPPTPPRTIVKACESVGSAASRYSALPQWNDNEKDGVNTTARIFVRASESGKGYALPLTITPPPTSSLQPLLPPPRKRTVSTPNIESLQAAVAALQDNSHSGLGSSYTSSAVTTTTPPPSMPLPSSVALRSNSDGSASSPSTPPSADDSTYGESTDRSGRLRRRTTVHVSENDPSQAGGGNPSNNNNNGSSNKDSRERTRSPSPKPVSRKENMGGVMMTVLHMLQVIAIFTIFCLVYDSHSKMNMAAIRLKDYKDGFLTFGMEEVGSFGASHPNHNNLNLNNNIDNNQNAAPLLELHQQRLQKIGDELQRTIRTLQKQVQEDDRRQIVETFGSGPIQLAMDLEFVTVLAGGEVSQEEGPSRIVIQMFDETPHTAWNWLEQISRQAWDGAQFLWHAPHVIQAVPPNPSQAQATYNFTEIPPENHQTYTVGLTTASNGALNMYINLQDNSEHHLDDACVGKIVDGFDALQRLLNVPQTNSALDRPVTIKSVRALSRMPSTTTLSLQHPSEGQQQQKQQLLPQQVMTSMSMEHTNTQQ